MRTPQAYNGVKANSVLSQHKEGTKKWPCQCPSCRRKRAETDGVKYNPVVAVAEHEDGHPWMTVEMHARANLTARTLAATTSMMAFALSGVENMSITVQPETGLADVTVNGVSMGAAKSIEEIEAFYEYAARRRVRPGLRDLSLVTGSEIGVNVAHAIKALEYVNLPWWRRMFRRCPKASD